MRLPIAAALATAAVSLTFYPLFREGTWFWAGTGAVLVVGAVSVLTARNVVPQRLGPTLQLLALLIYLTVVFAGDRTWAWVIPTKDTAVTLAGLLGAGFTDIQRYAAPVPANPGVTLLTAGGIGLIAVLVDLLAVRLRRAALAGLPLLALFTVPAAVMSDPLGWPAFILGALGYVGLLAADGRERLSHWGRAVLVPRSRGAGGAGGTPPSISGKRIGVAAIVVAVGLPALIPTLEPNPLFGFGVGPGKGRGGNTITIPDPIAGLRGQLAQPGNATVLTYTSNDNLPRYLRMYSLDVFDGGRWTMSQPKGRPQDAVSKGPLPSPPGLSPTIPTTRVTTRVQVSDAVKNLSFLPLPYPTSSVMVEGDWRADQTTLMVFSTHDTAGGREYGVVGHEPQPSPGLLGNLTGTPPAKVAARYLWLPASLPERIRALSAGLVASSDTPYQMAVKLQEWFTSKGRFTYSFQTRGNGSDALLDFLSNRTGYCEQFAAAMAVMARTLGIPARVAIGYTGGTFLEGAWRVRTHDLHAWPELYFEGAGWLRFEPTPAGGLGQATARVPDYSRPPVVTDGTGAPASASPTADPDATDPAGALARQRRTPRDPDPGLSQDPMALDTGPSVPARIGTGLAALLLLALIPGAWRSATRRRRERAWAVVPAGGSTSGRPVAERLGRAVRGTWHELTDTLRDLGLGHDASETPRALARRIGERHGLDAAASASLARITAAEERLRYARTPGDMPSLAGDARVVCQALRGVVPRRRRLRAVLLPTSTLLRLRAAGERVLDGFDRLENIRLRPRHRDRRAMSAEPPAEQVLTSTRR